MPGHPEMLVKIHCEETHQAAAVSAVVAGAGSGAGVRTGVLATSFATVGESSAISPSVHKPQPLRPVLPNHFSIAR
jgi:hypothetical protein